MSENNASRKLHIVIGLGKSGIGAAKLLQSSGDNVIIIDNGKRKSLTKETKELTSQGIKIIFPGDPLSISNFSPWIDQISSVIISPSIPWDHKALIQLRDRGIKIKSEIELGWEYLKGIPWVAITGTNGKTTVTHMIQHVLSFNHIKSDIAGNVGESLCELAYYYKNREKTIADWLVVELSSYQIESSPLVKPHIGLWTNLTPDHLERHGSIENYCKIKKSLLDRSDHRIYNGNDEFLASNKEALAKGSWVNTSHSISSQESSNIWVDEEGFLIQNNQKLFNSSLLNIPGNHNLQNLLLVTSAALKIGLKPEEIANAISTFKGVPHRLERLGTYHQIQIFNDSKATNYQAASIAIKAVPSPSIVIAGGQSKKGESSSWINELKKSTAAVILFGHSAQELAGLIESVNYRGTVILNKNLEEAVIAAINIGVKLKAKTLLLSPACASFDQYKNFEERGDHFKKLIESFVGK